MAKTPRAERRANDFYETPKWCTRAILPFLDRRLAGPRILEPAAGAGAICRELVEWFPGAKLDAFDIAPKGSADIAKADFFEIAPRPDYDLVITNPPFSLALEFCQRALLWRRTPGSVVAMLLRLGFLGAQKRGPWLRENTPSVYVTPRRPSFTGGGNDSAEYAWMVWGPGPPRVVILETDLLDEEGLR